MNQMWDLCAVSNPMIWVGAAIFGTALLAPRYLPMLGRFLGRLVGREIRRRVGFIIPDLPTMEQPKAGPRVVAIEVEETRPSPIVPKEEMPVVDAVLKPQKRPATVAWIVGFCVVAAGIFWWLLSGR